MWDIRSRVPCVFLLLPSLCLGTGGSLAATITGRGHVPECHNPGDRGGHLLFVARTDLILREGDPRARRTLGRAYPLMFIQTRHV
ncbi:hypothetical protein F4778DRAFT_733201 [Xylariomycetidae sp. FL2044]|nr:hypothetical protein F4778DRAFT_733201 [Xylariomycetidae sp. FL2044]